MTGPATTAHRVPGWLALGQGTAYVVLGPWLVRTVSGRPPSRLEVALARVLGARLVLQGAALLLTPGGALSRVGRLTAAVDGVHAVSMAALAARSPGHRRLALASAGGATVSALATLALGAPPDPRRHS